jgi:Flp pilus assembly protein TadD
MRVTLLVGAAALAVAGVVVGVTLATRTDVQKERAGPLRLATDPTARPTVAREVSEALAAWPSGTVRRLRVLAEKYPRSGVVRTDLGIALELTGQHADALRAWREARRVDPDSPSAVRAADLLHPDTPRGLAPFVPSFGRPVTATQAHLLRGALLQQLLRPMSARREFDAAARLAPRDPEALTAAAVGRYDKDRPAAAFSRLGPLVRRFPRAQTVRFHLGLLLIYFGDLARARHQLAAARAQGPGTLLGKRATTLLRAGRAS